jgi:acetyl esterase/lipase
MRVIETLIAVLFCLSTANAQTVYKLWQGAAPGALSPGNTTADTPTITDYLPPAASANGAAIIVCPGGGYGTVAGNYEGADVANWFKAKGFAGFVLKYRVAPYKHPCPMWDVQRAIRFVRSRAQQWNIDTSRVGIAGFSAGGHLASTALTHYTGGNPSASDTFDRRNSKPSFGILIYPVITMDLSFTHKGSRDNLLGTNPSQALVDSLSNEKQVNAQTSPCYLAHGTIDATVPIKNSRVFYDSCLSHKVNAHFYIITLSCGGHGFGLNCGNWADSSYNWLRAQGFLSPNTMVQKKSRPPIGVSHSENTRLFVSLPSFWADLPHGVYDVYSINGQRIGNTNAGSGFMSPSGRNGIFLLSTNKSR